MHSTFAHDIASDRQASLLHDAGVDHKAAPKLAQMAASERAEVAASRRAPRSFSATGRLRLVSRRSPGLAAV